MRGGPDATGVWGYRTALRSQKRGAAEVDEARAARGPRLRSPSQHRSKAVCAFLSMTPALFVEFVFEALRRSKLQHASHLTITVAPTETRL